MNIPASYLFSDKKFKEFKNYLKMSGITDDGEYTITNDIGIKGKILNGASLSHNPFRKALGYNSNVSFGIGDYEIKINTHDKEFGKVYIPGVNSVYFGKETEQTKIKEVYIQPNPAVDSTIISIHSWLRRGLEIRSLYMRAIPEICISGIIIEELHIQDSGKNILKLDYLPDRSKLGIKDKGSIPKLRIIADSKNTIVYRKNGVIFVDELRVNGNDLKVMNRLVNGRWSELCNKYASIRIVYGNLMFGNISVDPNEIPNNVWKSMKKLFERGE